MVTSILFVSLFVSCLLGILLYPKVKVPINGVKCSIVGILAILCYQTLGAGIYNLFHIEVDIKTTCISMFVLDLILWIWIL